MTTQTSLDRNHSSEANPSTLVWIDAREAVIVRLQDGRARVERVASDVPPRHRALGHVRRDPDIRHGGGGAQTAGEPRRLEHLKRFVEGVGDRLGPGDDLLILGPATVHERLARSLVDSDSSHGRDRLIACVVSPRLTDGQLIARLRRFAGVELRRHTVGAYRWTQLPSDGSSHGVQRPPCRISDKPHRGR